MIICKLSAILGERRFKVSDVTRDTGIARATVDRYYHDTVKSFDREVLSKLCDYLKVAPADLLKVVEQGQTVNLLEQPLSQLNSEDKVRVTAGASV